jgi:hypothetical protein
MLYRGYLPNAVSPGLTRKIDASKAVMKTDDVESEKSSKNEGSRRRMTRICPRSPSRIGREAEAELLRIREPNCGSIMSVYQFEHFRWRIYFDGLCIKLKPILVDQELLDVLALISLELNHLAHLTVVHDGAIASCATSVLASFDVGNPRSIPNFFLMTLRIFF